MTWSFSPQTPGTLLLIAALSGLLTADRKPFEGSLPVLHAAAAQGTSPKATPSHPASNTLPVPRRPFPQRQTLTYQVDWRVFPAGTAVLHLEADGDAERVTMVADSIGSINLIFRVSDRFQSEFSRSKGCSASFSKQLIEGRRQVNSDQKFAYGQLRSTYDERNLISHIHRSEQSPIPACVTDPFSAMFYVGSQPLQVGEQFHFPVADSTRVTDVTLHVEARESVRTPSATYQTIRVQPTAESGALKARGNVWIWYTDDDRHLPVQMRARLFWGTLTFRLTSLE